MRHIHVQGTPIGISGLKEIVLGVRSLGLDDEAAIKDELIKRVSIRNYIPSTMKEEYKKALYEVYLKMEDGE